MNNLSEQFAKLNKVGACLSLRDQLLVGEEILNLKKALEQSTEKALKQKFGGDLNNLKKNISTASDARIQELQQERNVDIFLDYDPTFESNGYLRTEKGNLHPITIATQELVNIFQGMGFDVFDSAQIETQTNNFTIPGTPDYHSARSMQDTFFVDTQDEKGENYVMRTQVTANLASYAATHQAPFRVVFPGIVFRAENIDATHDINFHQFDMWLIDKGAVSIASLTSLINEAFKQFFDKPDLQVRIRPSYFPFTQPSLEIDIFCDWFKEGRWIEVAGAGPIHRAVLNNIGLDDGIYQGIAFGFGLTRLAQLKLQLTGLAQFYSGDLEFLRPVE